MTQNPDDRRRWHPELMRVAQDLFAADHADPLDVLLPLVIDHVQADFAIAATLDVDALSIKRVAPLRLATSTDLPSLLSVPDVALALGQGRPVLLTHLRGDVHRVETTDSEPVEWGSVMAAPLRANSTTAAVVVGRSPERAPFDQADLDEFSDLAEHAGAVLQMLRARADWEASAVLRAQDRIASELHDRVITEIFGVGMGLLSVAQSLEDQGNRDRLVGYVEALDDTVRQMREMIFEHGNRSETTLTLQHRILAMVETIRRDLGFDVHIEFAGPTRSLLPAAMSDDTIDILRAALSHTAQHASASHVTALITVSQDGVTVDLQDDGDGASTPARTASLHRLGQQALARDGTIHLMESAGPGTHLRWTSARVPDPFTLRRRPGGNAER